MPLTTFDHYTVRAQNLDASVAFYTEVLGLRAQTMSDLGFRLVLLFLGEQAVVNLLETGAGLDKFMGRPAPAYTGGAERITGNIEHLAFNGTDLAGFKARLATHQVKYSERLLPEFGIHQLFIDDPDGVELEINFPLS